MTRTNRIFECIGNINIGKTEKRGFFIFILVLLFYTCTGRYVKDHEFDYLILSQRWLPSACIEYIEKANSSSNAHFCTLPKNFKVWSIHGLWPTQNKSIGPFFCNRSLPFDIHKIETIEPQLELNWPNIEGGKTVASLWQHEWEKHGTCAIQLESLKNEFKYFNVSITLYETYNMELFFQRQIHPSKDGISVSYLFYALKNAFGKVPQIHCIHEVKTKQSYLSDIRLCFNKNLELIDCGNIYSNRFNSNRTGLSGLTNCAADQNIIIPDKINPATDSKATSKNSENLDYYKKLYDTLLFIRFLQWASV